MTGWSMYGQRRRKESAMFAFGWKFGVELKYSDNDNNRPVMWIAAGIDSDSMFRNIISGQMQPPSSLHSPICSLPRQLANPFLTRLIVFD